MFDEALDLLNKMPYSKDEAILTALLHGCVLHNNIPLGLHLAKQLEMLNPNEPAAFSLSQKLLASVDPMKAEDYRRRAKGMTRPGVSFIR
ncbi:hypothetical protein AQUCO_03700241v1 [Aquilegia coerulea]|uniref:Uncharacterized protein n=1 Tax=Aquilegia coerulea TaxID=218851 RepID=A0A2G5CU66_AQUCA|nr:hypothetical protein AQUCO_03700241v1 [Aquilegia coerulea]